MLFLPIYNYCKPHYFSLFTISVSHPISPDLQSVQATFVYYGDLHMHTLTYLAPLRPTCAIRPTCLLSMISNTRWYGVSRPLELVFTWRWWRPRNQSSPSRKRVVESRARIICSFTEDDMYWDWYRSINLSWASCVWNVHGNQFKLQLIDMTLYKSGWGEVNSHGS